MADAAESPAARRERQVKEAQQRYRLKKREEAAFDRLRLSTLTAAARQLRRKARSGTLTRGCTVGKLHKALLSQHLREQAEPLALLADSVFAEPCDPS